MRIKGTQDLAVVLRRYDSEKAKKAPSGRSPAPASRGGGAKVEFSAQVREFNTIRSELDRVPDPDEARVSAIRARIESGSYEIDLEEVAEGLIHEALDTSLGDSR